MKKPSIHEQILRVLIDIRTELRLGNVIARNVEEHLDELVSLEQPVEPTSMELEFSNPTDQ